MRALYMKPATRAAIILELAGVLLGSPSATRRLNCLGASMLTANVLDISHHNSLVGDDAFAQMKAFGVLGIIHKSSQGNANFDRTYEARRQAALDAGLLFGAYHFGDGSPVKLQVSNFLSAAQPDDGTLLALDYEPNGNNTMPLDAAQIFCEEVKARVGRLPVIYSGNLIKETLPQSGNVAAFFGSMRLWLAHYNDHPKWPAAWASPWLHQFSGDGINDHGIKVPGLAGLADLDYYAGNPDALAGEWVS